MFVFGYGSLLWYTNFPVEEKLVGRIVGFSRRFWQKSPDHRGTPIKVRLIDTCRTSSNYHTNYLIKPGRTVTLIPEKEAVVWGVAYKVPTDDVETVRKYLGWREKAGYEVEKVIFYPKDNQRTSFEVEVFISPMENNEYFAGPERIPDIAETVVSSVGPSGTNIDYVLRVAHCVRQLNQNVIEPHLFQLEAEVLRLCRERQLTDKTLVELNLC